MSKLLFIFEGDMPTISITRDIFSHLKNHPEINTDFKYLTDVTKEDIDTHDVIVFMRPMYVYAWKIARAAKKAGHTIVTFCDDDLLHLPKSQPTIPWRKKAFLKTLKYSDIIWSCNRYILNEYCDLTSGKRIAYIDTILQKEELDGIDINDRNNNQVKIVYAAGSSHAELFEKYIKPIVPDLLQEFGEKISFTFVGVHPQMDGIPCEFVSGMPLLEYRQYMKDNCFDIGLAPLNDDEFSKRKYFNKFIEYTTQGIMGIYTNTEPYTYVVEQGINGLLVNNNPKDWFDALERAIKDKTFRKECISNAVKYLQENHTEDAVIGSLEQAIPEMAKIHKEYNKCASFGQHKMLYYLSRILDLGYMTMFYLHHRGIKDVAARTKVHITGHAYSKK